MGHTVWFVHSMRGSKCIHVVVRCSYRMQIKINCIFHSIRLLVMRNRNRVAIIKSFSVVRQLCCSLNEISLAYGKKESGKSPLMFKEICVGYSLYLMSFLYRCEVCRYWNQCVDEPRTRCVWLWIHWASGWRWGWWRVQSVSTNLGVGGIHLRIAQKCLFAPRAHGISPADAVLTFKS